MYHGVPRAREIPDSVRPCDCGDAPTDSTTGIDERDKRAVAALTKAGIIDAVRDSGNARSNAEAADMVDTFFEVLKEALAGADKLKIGGFGTFIVRDKKARVGRNPQTGEPIEISARRVLSFKADTRLKARMNSEDE